MYLETSKDDFSYFSFISQGHLLWENPPGRSKFLPFFFLLFFVLVFQVSLTNCNAFFILIIPGVFNFLLLLQSPVHVCWSEWVERGGVRAGDEVGGGAGAGVEVS